MIVLGITISDTHRLGTPPHLISKPTKAPRDIIVRFQNGIDRTLVWNDRSKLKNSKFILSEGFSPVTQDKVNKLLKSTKPGCACQQWPEVYCGFH